MFVCKSMRGFGRAGEIRTRDLLHPNQDVHLGRIRLINSGSRHSYKIDYTGIPRNLEFRCILLILLVGAGRFERPTPCAQGGIQEAAKAASFQLLEKLGVPACVRELVERCGTPLLWAATNSSTTSPNCLGE